MFRFIAAFATPAAPAAPATAPAAFAAPATGSHYFHTWQPISGEINPDGSHTNHWCIPLIGALQRLYVVSTETSEVQHVVVGRTKPNEEGELDISYILHATGPAEHYRLTAHVLLSDGSTREFSETYPVTTNDDYTDDESAYGSGEE